MGTWGFEPWGNDTAADWFGDTMDSMEISQRVEAALNVDVNENFDQVRAAAAIVVLLGRNYVWPIENIDRIIELAATKLEELLKVPEVSEAPELVTNIKHEIAILRSRLPESDKQLSEETLKYWATWTQG